MRLSFKEFFLEKIFLEKRRDKRPRVGAYEQLSVYKDDPTIFISFTEVEKIGINPRSKYNTPIGIYTYPLAAFWKNYDVDSLKNIGKTAPFAGDQPWIHVVQLKNPQGFVSDIKNYSSDDLERDLNKIRSMITDKDNRREYIEDIIQQGVDEARSTPASEFSKIWNVTRLLSDNSLACDVLNLKSKKAPVAWNVLLRRLGYTGFSDPSDTGTIHEYESTQAVFLDRRAFKTVDKIANKQPINKERFKGGKWDGGIYKGTTMEDSYWLAGTWRGEEFIRGTWKSGTWTGGKFLESLWRKGEWKGGYFARGTWHDGVWEDGTFEDSTWRNGIWKNGTWESGTWVDGVWENGVWEDGTWHEGTWHGGKWKGGMWRTGDWHGGTWRGGMWFSGNWHGGVWIRGSIYSSTHEEYVESYVDPIKFAALEKETETLTSLKEKAGSE